MIDPDTIFDCQIKRIHEYKRQLLNALRIVVIYNRIRQNPNLEMPPRTFLFAGKAAPAYHLAKVIIKFINNLGSVIDNDPMVRGRLNVVFLPEYNVSLAERLIPASDVSNQISTAGYEASGTSNMKFMMNGALTVGTRDGATIEMAEEAGEDNMFLFGLTVEQVQNSRGWYNPQWHYDNEPETRAALDLIFSGYFNRYEPGIFDPLRETLLTSGDHYMHLADLTSYVQAQERLGTLYADPDAWSRKAILNVAARVSSRATALSRNMQPKFGRQAMSSTVKAQLAASHQASISPLAERKPAPKKLTPLRHVAGNVEMWAVEETGRTRGRLLAFLQQAAGGGDAVLCARQMELSGLANAIRAGEMSQPLHRNDRSLVQPLRRLTWVHLESPTFGEE